LLINSSVVGCSIVLTLSLQVVYYYYMNTIAQQSTIQVRIDEGTKTRAIELFNKLGLDMSTAIKMFLKKSVDASALPFTPSLTVNGYTSAQEAKMLREVKKVLKNGKFYTDIRQMHRDILGDDYDKYVRS